MKARDSVTGQFKDVYVKALDSMPVGTQIEYTGDTIPTGWEEVNDYSTTEINTGKKWIDGKPIYRKVINYTGVISTNNGDNTTIGTITNISDCISLKSIFYRGTNNISPVPYISWAYNSFSFDNTQNYYIGISNDEIKVIVQRGNNATPQNITKVIAIIEYTKTTD